MLDSLRSNIMVPHSGFQWRQPCENPIPLVGTTIVIHVRYMVGIIGYGGIVDGIVDGIVERVGIIERIVAIEGAATFPSTRL